jgi:uncharacterized protein YdeI (YjbR/CyaY-like superfamily)
MEMTLTTCPADRSEWRAWLEKNHTAEKEVWLIYYKKGTGIPSPAYLETLEEALCFGWIDSIIQKIDDERYARKFNPRRPGSHWSDRNKNLVPNLVTEGRMTDAGLAKVDFPLSEGDLAHPKHSDLSLPDWLKEGLMINQQAWKNFNQLAPSHRRNYIAWITAAKKTDTRLRRIQQAIQLLEKNQRLGLK